MDFKKYTYSMSSLFAVLGLIVVILGVLVKGDNVYTGIIYVLIGVLQLLIATTAFPRFRNKDEVGIGNITVQHNWWILSVGVAALALFPSAFFSIPATSLVYLTTGIALIWVVLSVTTIYVAVKRTNARLVI